MAQSTQFGAFLPTTDDLDVDSLYNSNLDPFVSDLLVRLYQSYNNIALIMNLKDTGYYLPIELVNGQQYFAKPSTALTPAQITNQTRQVYRTVVDFGTLPNAGSTSIAHNIEGISAETSFTRIYGAATDPLTQTYIPLPYVSSAGGNQIELSVDATNVIVTTPFNWSAYTTTYIILEYLKN